MEATVKILITDIDKQVVHGKNKFIKDCFYKVCNEVDELHEKTGTYLTDSDFEYIKYELEYRYSIFVTWEAISKFFGIEW